MKPRSQNKMKACFLVIAMLSLACNLLNRYPELTAMPPLFPKASVQPEILHYENELVAFDYPAGARIFAAGEFFYNYPYENNLGGELVVGLADPGWIIWNYGTFLESSIGVYRHTLPSGSSLEEVMQTAYTATFIGETVPEEVPEQSGMVTIDNLSAVQKTYRLASESLWYTLQDIWIEKDSSILRLSLWKQPNQEDFQAIADLFLSSLDIKDDLSLNSEEPTPSFTASPTPYPPALLKHFENDLVSFDYPQELVNFQPGDPLSVCFPDFQLGGELVVGMGDPKFLRRDQYYRSIRIYRLSMPAGSNFESIFIESYLPIEEKYIPDPGVLKLPDRIDIAGWTAIQKTYRITSGEPTYELRDIWIPKGDQVFILSIWTEYTNPEDFSLFQSGADAFLNSLVLK